MRFSTLKLKLYGAALNCPHPGGNYGERITLSIQPLVYMSRRKLNTSTELLRACVLRLD